jgi:hypothetical protein
VQTNIPQQMATLAMQAYMLARHMPLLLVRAVRSSQSLFAVHQRLGMCVWQGKRPSKEMRRGTGSASLRLKVPRTVTDSSYAC